MSLPKINTPEYRLNVPSTDEEIRYRPFLVKEEKLLLIAQETGNEKATYEAIRKIITSDDAAGRQLDFLMQELNREANTLASKSADAETTKTAVELKVLIEQMREQIQNVE